MLSVNTPTDTDETARDSSDSTTPEAKEAMNTESESPRAKDDGDQPTVKDSASTEAEKTGSDKPDTPVKKSPKHESKKSDNESQSEGADPK